MRSPESTKAPRAQEGRGIRPPSRNELSETQESRPHQWAQAIILVALYSFPAIAYLRVATVADPDVWWQMRTGEWILQHGAVPRADPFSSFGAGKPWEAYSWLFDLIVLQFFERLGLVGLATFTAGMAVAVTVLLHRMIRRLQADFTLAVLLTVAATCCISHLDWPRSWWFSVLFFVLEIDILMHARKTGKSRELACLPLIFALWANLHIQFIDGLVVLAIAVGETLLSLRWTSLRTRIRPVWLCGISFACVVAPLANPYGWKIYRTAYSLASQSGVLDKVSELQPMAFRNLADWCVLLLALAAAAVLARVRRPAPFEIMMLAFGVAVSFRTQRDAWVAASIACALIASKLKGDERNRLQLKASAAPLIAIGVTLVVFLGFRVLRVNDAQLQTSLAEAFPVRAVEVVKERGYTGPLYNDYGWGGYLIWALRMPVDIDGRAAFDGDARINRSVATWSASANWASDPDLKKANLVIGSVNAPLISLLRMDPCFDLAFEDNVAAIFIARKESSTAPTRKPLAAPTCATTRPTRK